VVYKARDKKTNEIVALKVRYSHSCSHGTRI
jgi:hypothetical protein